MDANGKNMTGDDRRNERIRIWAAWLLLSLPLFVHPLFWIRMFRARLIYWDRVTLVTLPVLAAAAAAVLLLTGWGDLRRKCRCSRLNMLLVTFAAALMALSLARTIYSGGRWNPADWYLPLMPLAGMALSREIMRILPRWGTLVLGVLIVFTLRFPFYIGLPGNWNWNLSLLTVLLPAPFVLWHPKPRQFWQPALLATLLLTVFSLVKPDLSPRGVIVGVIVASAALWLFWQLPRRQRIFITILGGAAGMAMFLSIWLGPADPAIRSSRFWLWRGSVELALRRGVFGTGAGKFEREINPYLPRAYYFSKYATNLHTHPHNELLAAWCEFGVLGVGFLLLLTLRAVSGLRNYSAVRVWGFWLFMVLFLHGQVDVLLQTPLAGTLCLVVGGALAGTHTKRNAVLHPKLGMAGAAATLTLAGVTFCSSWCYREALLNHGAGDDYLARQKVEKSLALWDTPAARYMAGRIELLLRDPEAAIRHFERLAPGYVHSNLYMGIAYADMGEACLDRGDKVKALRWFKEALRCLDMEGRQYPMSALNADVELTILKRLGEDEELLHSRKDTLRYLLERRGISLEELRANHALDDIPLRRNP